MSKKAKKKKLGSASYVPPILKRGAKVGPIFSDPTRVVKSPEMVAKERKEKTRLKNKAARAARKITHAASAKKTRPTARVRAISESEKIQRAAKQLARIERGVVKKEFKKKLAAERQALADAKKKPSLLKKIKTGLGFFRHTALSNARARKGLINPKK